MKVLHLLVRCTLGGAETLLLDYFKLQNSPNIEPYLLYFKEGWAEEKFKAIVPHCQFMKRKEGIDPLAILKLASYIIKHNIDIVHAHNTVDYVYGLFATALTGKKLVVTFHGYDDTAPPFHKWLLRKVLANADASVFVSEVLRQHYSSHYSIKSPFTVYNGIDFDKFRHQPNDLRLELGLSPETIIFGTVGNFVNNVRDQFLICKSLAIAMKVCNFHFVFVGHQSIERPEIMQSCIESCRASEILDRVHFLGGRLDVPSILQNFDAYIYASNLDTFGISVLEAVSCNLPIIINNLPIFREVLNDCDITFYPTKDSNALAREIQLLVANVKNKANTKTNALIITSRFSINEYAFRIHNIYNSVITP